MRVFHQESVGSGHLNFSYCYGFGPNLDEEAISRYVYEGGIRFAGHLKFSGD